MQILADTQPATERQIAFLHTLFDEKFNAVKAAECHEWLNAHRISSATASDKIGKLMALPTYTEEIEDGIYRLADGEIFKVYHTRRGFLATKQLTEDGFFYTGRDPLRRIKASDRMTKAEAAEYGAIYGRCVNCQRTLTDETSIAQGYGPVCAQYFA